MTAIRASSSSLGADSRHGRGVLRKGDQRYCYSRRHADLVVCTSGRRWPDIDILLGQGGAVLRNHADIVACQSLLIAQQLCGIIFAACTTMLTIAQRKTTWMLPWSLRMFITCSYDVHHVSSVCHINVEGDCKVLLPLLCSLSS